MNTSIYRRTPLRLIALVAALSPLPAQYNALEPASFPALAGIAPGDDHGSAALRVCDIDADGVADMAIGAPGYIGLGLSLGRVVFVSAVTGAALFTTSGGPGDLLGESLAAVGDVDADGEPDIAASARGQNRVLWISSRTGLVVATTVGPMSFGAVLIGLPDVTGDGRPDLAVAAPYAGGGSVSVVSCATQAIVGTVSGAILGGEFGAALAAIPDRDGDGYWDLAIGAPRNGGATTGALYMASTGTFLKLNSGNPIRTGLGNLGASVALASDLNGDGQREIAVGSPSLGTTGNVQFVSPLDGYAHRVLAPNTPVQRFGASLRIDADFDRDGVPDVVIGAPGFDAPGVTDVGAIYAFRGVDGRLLFSYAGNAPGDALGSRLSGVGDIDGNRTDDVVAFAPQHPAPVIGSGYMRAVSYVDPMTPPMGVLSAGLLGTTRTAEFSFDGVAPNAQYLVVISRTIAPVDVLPGLRIHADLSDPLALIVSSIPSFGTSAGTGLFWNGGAGSLQGGKAAFSLRLPASMPGLTFFCEAFALGAGGRFRAASSGIVTLAFTDRFAPVSSLLSVAPGSWGLANPVVLFQDLANPGSPPLNATQLPAGYVASLSTGPIPSIPSQGGGPNPSIPGLTPTSTGAAYSPPGAGACWGASPGPNPSVPSRSVNLLAMVTSPSGQVTAFSTPMQVWTGDCPVIETRVVWQASANAMIAGFPAHLTAGVAGDGVTATGGVQVTGWQCIGPRISGTVSAAGTSVSLVIANPCCSYFPRDHSLGATTSSLGFVDGMQSCLGLLITPVVGTNFTLHYLRTITVYRSRM